MHLIFYDLQNQYDPVNWRTVKHSSHSKSPSSRLPSANGSYLTPIGMKVLMPETMTPLAGYLATEYKSREDFCKPYHSLLIKIAIYIFVAKFLTN